MNTVQKAIKQLEKEIRNQPEKIRSNINRFELLRYLVSEIIRGKSFIRVLNFLMNPTKNKFKLIAIDKIPLSNGNNKRELWFEGQYLMIREDIARHII